MSEPRPIVPARILAALLLLGLAFLSTAAHAVAAADVPSPRPVGWSVDLTGRVPKATLAEIDRLGNEVKAKNGEELMVVVVGTTGDAPSHAFATELFNRWHIGREAGKGVLVFVALDDRQLEIVVGRGLNSPSLQEATATILKRDMVPALRQGDPGGAVLAGARSSARDLLGVAPGSATAPTATAAAPVEAAKDSGVLRRSALAVLLLVAVGVLGWLAYRFSQRRGSPDSK